MADGAEPGVERPRSPPPAARGRSRGNRTGAARRRARVRRRGIGAIPGFLTPDAPVYRVGRFPDPWQPADWALAGPDGTFGNRFDDPQRTYRVLYASSQRLGCFLETLARFRVDVALLAELAEIDGPDDFFPLGLVPAEWPGSRLIGSAELAGRYADLYASRWVGLLRRKLAPVCVAYGIADLDMASLESAAPRALTQAASRIVYEQGYDGILYLSRYGREIRNWAVFEPFRILPGPSEPVRADDPDLARALQIHGLMLQAR